MGLFTYRGWIAASREVNDFTFRVLIPKRDRVLFAVFAAIAGAATPVQGRSWDD